MNKKPARVTKNYAVGLVAAVILLVMAILVACWGLLSLFTDTQPVEDSVSFFTAPVLVGVNLVILAVVLWRQTLSLLRGQKAQWSLALVVPGVVYLVWCLGGLAFGMTINETWISPYAITMAAIWAIGLGIFWGIFLRKLYSSSPEVPKWPWEEREDRERRGEE